MVMRAEVEKRTSPRPKMGTSDVLPVVDAVSCSTQNKFVTGDPFQAVKAHL
jgi:hypothetical protein